jgi:hypothetical protein
MSILHKITIRLALLILLAAGARPTHGGSASVGEATPAPAASEAPATLEASARQSLSRLSSLITTNPRSAAPVLVIPAQEMAPETCDRIVEDLSVMSRILEKSITAAPELYGALANETGAWQILQSQGYVSSRQGDTTLPWVFRSSSGRCKPMYVGGYGAIFSLRVGFPLVPPPEAPKQEQTAAPTEQVWAAAQRELANPPSSQHVRAGALHGIPYRPEAVDGLKSTLIAALKHATNIRDLEPESWLTVLVQGPRTVQLEELPRPRDDAVPELGTSATGRSLLTLRAKKADIDQCAKGSLEQSEFQKRAQITTY